MKETYEEVKQLIDELGYDTEIIDDGTERIIADCGCSACRDRVQPGHFNCNNTDPELDELENKGLIYRAYDDNQWSFFISFI